MINGLHVIQVWSQDEEGFYEANVSSTVYTEPEQQEVVGLPDGAMLVTLALKTNGIQQWQLKPSTFMLKTPLRLLPCSAGYFFDNPLKIDFLILFTMPRTVDFAARQVCSHGTGASRMIDNGRWLQANRQPFGSWRGQRSIQQPPPFFKEMVA